MMITLERCTSIFEVTFGVNAVAAAAALYFRATHREVARRLLAELRPSNSPLSGPYVEQQFEAFVLRASLGLQGARFTYRILMALGLAAATSAVVGLVVAATDPHHGVSARAVWFYAVGTIIVLPCLYWLYQQFLGWFERAFLARRTTEAERRLFWSSFEAILPIPELLAEQQRFMAELNARMLALKWRRLGRRLGDLLERLRHPVAALRRRR